MILNYNDFGYPTNSPERKMENHSIGHGGLFKSIIEFNNFKTVVEIGVCRATTTKYLCEAVKTTGGSVHGYDLWETHGLKKQFKALSTKEKCEEYLNKFNFKNYKLIKIDTTSQEFRDAIKNNHKTIDFAFIDGCHSYSGVKNDFDVIYPYLSSSGVIAFHDTQMIDGCREFILDLRTKYNDGTYDIIDFPWGNGKKRCGVSLLVKRSYPVLKDIGLSQVCGSPSSPEEIRSRELEWYKSQLK